MIVGISSLKPFKAIPVLVVFANYETQEGFFFTNTETILRFRLHSRCADPKYFPVM